MKFKRGQSGNPRGRPQGAVAKFRPDIAKMFAENNFNPLLNLIKLEPTLTEVKDKIKCNEILAPYFAPILKSIELTAEEKSLFKFSINIVKDEKIDESNNI